MFKYQNLTIEDQYQPNISSNGLKRILSINGESNLFCRAANADYIEKINEDFYSVGGFFYFKNLGEVQPIIREINGLKELLYPLQKDNKIVYSLFW